MFKEARLSRHLTCQTPLKRIFSSFPRTDLSATRRQASYASVLFLSAAISLPAAQLVVQWDDNSGNETGYEIQRTEGGNPFATLGTVPANVTTFVDTAVIQGMVYAYRVRAYNHVQSSAFSNITEFVAPRDGNGGEGDYSAKGLAAPTSKLVNLSARAVPGTNERSLIVGFVVRDGPKSVLLRAVGPGIPGVSGASVSADPAFIVNHDGFSVGGNDNWKNSGRMSSVSDRVGAFPLVEGSSDAALLAGFLPGGNTMLIEGGGSGFAMAEIYDADSHARYAGRLVNLSVRAHTEDGDGVLIVGFVISGITPMRVLLRASGPALSDLGVDGAVADPQLTLFQGSHKRGYNDNWGGREDMNAAFAEAGAFEWGDAGSADAAMISTLAPGAYTAVVSGVGSTNGVVGGGLRVALASQPKRKKQVGSSSIHN
jgi:hypothetical protein